MAKKNEPLDYETTANKIYNRLNETAEQAKSIYFDKNRSLEEKVEALRHIEAKVAGMCDIIHTLGYELRGKDDMLLTQLAFNKAYSYRSSAEIDLRKKNA